MNKDTKKRLKQKKLTWSLRIGGGKDHKEQSNEDLKIKVTF